jgi:HEAT repeat protein
MITRETLKELDGLLDVMAKGSPEARQAVTTRLMGFEQSGRVPFSALLTLADEANPSVAMYAIAALGRSKRPEAVKKLAELLERHREGNPLFLETVVDALGETGDTSAGPALLAAIGINTAGWSGKLLSRLSRKKADEAAIERRRERLTLPVLRALEKLVDGKTAPHLRPFLDHNDPFVRWHAIQALVAAQARQFNDRLRAMAQQDDNELVREMAGIALAKLAPLPERLNN